SSFFCNYFWERSVGIGCARKSYGERASVIQFALDVNRSAVLFDNPFRKTQPKTRTANLPAARGVRAEKTLEDVRNRVRRNTLAGIGNFDKHDSGGCPGMNRYSPSGRRVLNCIIEKIDQDQFQPLGIDNRD